MTPIFENVTDLQTHRVVSQRVRDLEVVQDAAEHVEQLLDPQTGHVTHN